MSKSIFKKGAAAMISAAAVMTFAACEKDDTPRTGPEETAKAVYILNEGSWGQNNSTISVYDLETGTVTNSWYSAVNCSSLGDTGNDILVIDDYIIIAVNTSNIIQFCDRNGKAVAQSEEVPGCRRLAVDDAQKNLYVTSYASDGYVAKIDLSTFKVTATVNVGYEPDGIAYYNGKLYVANTGGYAYTGTHDYEETISIVDASSMTETKRVKTGMLNLYGGFIQNEEYPQYILVNASGDYMSNPAGSMVFDCKSESIIATYDFPATYASQYDGTFYALGSSFDYTTYASTYYCHKIDMSTGTPSVSEGLAPKGTGAEDGIVTAIKGMDAPYGLFVAPTGEVFVTDAGDYSSRGSLYVFNPDGTLKTKQTVGVCPAHFAAK